MERKVIAKDPRCKNFGKPKPNGQTNPSILKEGKYSGKTVKFENDGGANGGDTSANTEINKLIKAKVETLPAFKDIPADAEHTVTKDGKEVAKFCKKCRRFTRGAKMHSTKEHKSKKKSGLVATAAVSINKPPLPPVMESAMQWGLVLDQG